MNEEQGEQGIQGELGERGPQGQLGERGDSGLQGATGERGMKGDHGQHGEQGARGVQGVQGPPGLFGRNVTLSFFAIIAISFAILSAGSWQVHQTRQVVKENRRVIDSLCNTTTTLDAALVVPFLVETKLALKVVPVGEGKARLARIKENLEIAHEELSATSACEGVR